MIAPPFHRSTRSARPSVVVAVHADVDLLEQGAQQLLAVLVGGGRRRPHPVEVVAEGEDGLLLLRREGFRARGLSAGEFGLGVGQLLQRGVPLGFQAAGDQPVVGVDGPVAALGSAGPVAGLFDLAAPLGQRGVVAVLELLGGGQAGLQRGRRERGQERLGDRGVDRGATDPQVPGAAALDQLAGAGAVVAGRGLGRARRSRRRACARSSRRWPGLAAARSPPGPRRCPAGAPGAGVGADAGLVGLVGVPVDEPAMVIGDEHLPLALRQPTAADAQHGRPRRRSAAGGSCRTRRRPHRRGG